VLKKLWNGAGMASRLTLQFKFRKHLKLSN